MSQKFQAVLKNVRLSPRKARLVVNLIRGRSVENAVDILRLTNKKAAPMVLKLVESAMSSAQARATVDIDNLTVSDAFVDEGQTLKRFMPRAQGRASPIRKRTSHITIRLSES